MQRRNFLQRTSILAGIGSLSGIFQPAWARRFEEAMNQYASFSPEGLAGEEEFWQRIREAYTVSSGVINLNNGGVSPSPKVVQDAMKRYHDLSQEAPSYYMWRILDQGREPLRKRLADLSGCSAEEVAIHRSASEALETVIFGLPLQKGDEVVLSRFDYPNMMNAWKQREMRDGIKLVWVDLQLPSEDEKGLVEAYTSKFTARTKLVHITHVINWTGQILPCAAIANAAHAKGIEVLVDGAHSFAHLVYKIPDLQADYFGTSLHKWLCASIGTGMMYIKKEKIGKIYPFFAAQEPMSSDIRKFESLGTRPFYIEQATLKAIEFHEMIGAERKWQRLTYLKNYWVSKVKDNPKISIHTPTSTKFSGAIAVVGVEGKTVDQISNTLFDKEKIHVTGIDHLGIKGVRVSPNVYTLTRELDRLVNVLSTMAGS